MKKSLLLISILSIMFLFGCDNSQNSENEIDIVSGDMVEGEIEEGKMVEWNEPYTGYDMMKTLYTEKGKVTCEIKSEDLGTNYLYLDGKNFLFESDLGDAAFAFIDDMMFSWGDDMAEGYGTISDAGIESVFDFTDNLNEQGANFECTELLDKEVTIPADIHFISLVDYYNQFYEEQSDVE